MKFYGLLPIGSVVLLENSERKVMIIGICQKQLDAQDAYWEYAAVPYPQGYLDEDNLFLFNGSQIKTVFATGYQDMQQFAFSTQVQQALAKTHRVLEDS